MSSNGQIVAVNISEAKGTIKHPVDEITLDAHGICGDAHAGPWHRQVSLLAQESIDVFAEDADRAIASGEFAENLTVQGIDLAGVAMLDRFRIGDVELEVSQIGKRCHGAGCAIFQEVGTCVMPKEGIFSRVIQGGCIRPGDAIKFLPRALSVLLVTMSDRASAGEYEDRSGPRAAELLTKFFAEKRWHLEVRTALLPDDADRLRSTLSEAISEGVDAIFTLGGTGIGPRDISPETVASLCEKMMPGIMEGVRTTFGTDHPAARLSRSVAGIAGRTQLYALPGSVRAVEEYVGEILKTFEHALCTLHGLDLHGSDH